MSHDHTIYKEKHY